MSEAFSFRLTAADGAARTGEITTAHGVVHTPAFMPVGTQAAIKGVHHDDVRALLSVKINLMVNKIRSQAGYGASIAPDRNA